MPTERLNSRRFHTDASSELLKQLCVLVDALKKPWNDSRQCGDVLVSALVNGPVKEGGNSPSALEPAKIFGLHAREYYFCSSVPPCHDRYCMGA